MEAFSALPTFLTMSRQSQLLPESQPRLDPVDTPAESNFRMCCYDEMEKLEQQVLQESNVAGLVSTAMAVSSFNVRLQALNRIATLPESSNFAHASCAARSFLTNKSELFQALVGTAQSSTPSFQPILRCELFITHQERSLCNRPVGGANPLSMPVISAAKLEFLLSQHCAEVKEACESQTPPALPWFNLNDLTFCVLHALRTTVRPIPRSTSHEDPALWSAQSFEADASVVALVHTYARFISLPVVVIVLREALLRMIDLPRLRLDTSLQEHLKEFQGAVLLQYICAALSLLECPLIPCRLAAQVVCGVFTADLLSKLWRWFVFDTAIFSDTLVCALDRVAALLVSKSSGPKIAAESAVQEKPERALEVLALCAPVLCLCETVARHGAERQGYSMLENSVYHRLQVNCTHLLSIIHEPSLLVEGQYRSENEYKQPISIVCALTNSSQKLLLFTSSARFSLTRGNCTKTDASVEVKLKVTRKELALATREHMFRTQLCFADLLQVLLSCKEDGVKRSAPMLSDEEFDTLIMKNVIKAAQRSSAGEGWAPEDFTFVQLLEDSLDYEFNGNHK